MEWQDIHDPQKQYVFDVDWSEIATCYRPEEIQQSIEENGVAGMVTEINEFFASHYNYLPLMRSHIGNKPAILSRRSIGN